MKAGGMGARQNAPCQKGLDFLGTFVVNSGMKEYENSSRRHPLAPIPALNCTHTCAAAPAFPPKIDRNFNLAHARNPSERAVLLTASLIASGNHSQKPINTLNSAGYKFLIASISYEREGLKRAADLVLVYPELVRIDAENRRDVGISKRAGSKEEFNTANQNPQPRKASAWGAHTQLRRNCERPGHSPVLLRRLSSRTCLSL